MGERKQFSLFDLDLWPTTLTYNPRLAKVKVDPHAKNQGQRSNGSNKRAPTDKRTDTHTHTDATKRIISPATRSIKTENLRSNGSSRKTTGDDRQHNPTCSMCVVMLAPCVVLTCCCCCCVDVMKGEGWWRSPAVRTWLIPAIADAEKFICAHE